MTEQEKELLTILKGLYLLLAFAFGVFFGQIVGWYISFAEIWESFG